MADSNIEWTEKTWNPTTGCTKISKECDNCYAEVMTNRMMHMPNQPRYKAGFGVFAMHDDALGEPYKWKKPTTVFVNSMSDLFHKDMKIEFLQKIFKVMNDTPQHTYQVLTKRHHEITKYSKDLNWTDNIWMGVSVGSEAGVRRIEHLVTCGAKHKFLSVEPLLEELQDLNLKGIDLVIVGGESGDNSSRPVELDWILKVKKNCDQQGVPFFFKQWGMKKFNPDQNDPTLNKRHRYYAKGGCMINGKIYLSNPSNPNYDGTPTLELFGDEYYIMDDYYDFKTIWELKSYLPFMEDELYEQLKADIKLNGLNDPILFVVTPNGEKLVIEGHTRLRACIELKIKNIPTKEVKENFISIDDIKLWMVRHQFQRRNLSSTEKIELALLSRETIEKMAKENLFKAGKNIEINKSIDTYAEIAKIAGVGRTSVFMYSAIMDKASDSVKQKLRKGDISISSAYDKVKDLPEKKIAKPVNKANNYKILDSIEESQKLLADGKIQGVVLLKNKAQIDLLNNYVKTKFGIVITDV